MNNITLDNPLIWSSPKDVKFDFFGLMCANVKTDLRVQQFRKEIFQRVNGINPQFTKRSIDFASGCVAGDRYLLHRENEGIDVAIWEEPISPDEIDGTIFIVNQWETNDLNFATTTNEVIEEYAILLKIEELDLTRDDISFILGMIFIMDSEGFFDAEFRGQKKLLRELLNTILLNDQNGEYV